MPKPSLEDLFAETQNAPAAKNTRPPLENFFGQEAPSEKLPISEYFKDSPPEEPVKKYGMADALFKRFGPSAAVGTGVDFKIPKNTPGPLGVVDIFNRAFHGQDTSDLNRYQKSFYSGLARTGGEAVAQIPSAAYAAQAFPKNIAQKAVAATAKKLGLAPEGYSPKYDKVPDWLLNNPLSEYFGKVSGELNYNAKKYGQDNAFTLYAKGDPNAAIDWTVNTVIENLPYSLFSTAMTVSGASPQAVLVATSALAGLGMMKEEFSNPRLDEAQKMSSLVQKSIYEGLGEAAGAALFPFAVGLFEKAGVKAGAEVMKGALRKGIEGITFGMAEEGLEEYITQVMQGATDMYYRSKEGMSWKQVFDEAALNGYVGAASGGVYAGGAAMKATVEVDPKITMQGMDSAQMNMVDGIDVRLTLDQLMDIKSRLEAKSKGMTDPNTRETMIVPSTLSAEEVALLDRIEKDIASGNFHEPQEMLIKSLGEGLTGDIVVNMAKGSFDDTIREKISKGEELEPNEKAYLEDQKFRTEELKKSTSETAKGMPQEDYLVWANDRAKETYKTQQEILDARQLHKSLVDSGDFEAAEATRKAVSLESEIGKKTVSDMLELEDEIGSKIGDPALKSTASRLESKYKELEELDSMAIGEITPEYEQKAKKLIEEIKVLEEKKSAQEAERKDLESRKRGIQVSEPSGTYGVNWNKVNSYMKRKGYDFRGAEDAKEIFKNRIMKDGAIDKDVFPDHAAALEYASSIKKQTTETKAKRKFGLTLNFEEAGYLLSDGDLLDFSGRKDGYVGPPSRNIDHREIHKVYPEGSYPEGTSGTEEMIDFMNKGNIRLQSNGADISTENAPTQHQENALLKHIRINRGEYYLDFSGAKGYTVESKEYPLGTNASKIIQDIRSFFKKQFNQNNDISEPEAKYGKTKGGFYSAVERAVEEKLPASFSPEQALNTIKNTPGVKQEEIDWLGVEEFLKDKPKVSKQELLDFIKANQVEIKDISSKSTDKVERNLDIQQNASGMYQVIDIEESAVLETTETREEAEEARRQILESPENEPPSAQGPLATKFHAYVLPGGENYREVLLTLPQTKAPKDIKDPGNFKTWFENKGLKGDYESEFNNKEGALWKQYELELMAWLKSYDKGPLFTSSHWDEPNVLAHFRLNDRQTEKGDTLFIEEIQSDWHQAGRDKGYSGKQRSIEEIKKLAEENTAKQAALLDVNRTRPLPQEIVDQLRELTDEYNALIAESKNINNSVPDAPFKKTWHELALKKILKMAVDEGYDAIAWTTGEQQADRYDLSKQLDRVESQKRDDGRYFIKAVDKNGNSALDEVYSAKELPEIIGKELAEKIVNNNEERQTFGIYERHIFKDLDLKVGGEGMKGFYDQILPSFLNKYTKKWGGRAQMIDIGDIGQVKDLDFEQAKKLFNEGKSLFIESSDGGESQAESLDEIKSALDSGGTVFLDDESGMIRSTPVHGLEITTAMRESVKKGQALFEPSQDYLPGMGEDANLPSESEVAHGSKESAESAIQKAIQEIREKHEPKNVRRAGIVRALKEKKSVDFSGHKIDGPDTLAQLHQVFRSPAIETFVYYVTKPDGTIFVNRAISSGQVDQVALGEDFFDSVFMDLVDAGEGAKLWLAHNHPSGRTQASQEDIALTRKVKSKFPRAYEGHVVIDHGEYLHIDRRINHEVRRYATSPETEANDWRSGLNQVKDPDSLAGNFNDVLRAPENVHAVYMDKGGYVVAYEVLNPAEVGDLFFKTIKESMNRYAAPSYILMGDPKTMQALTEKSAPYSILPEKLLDIIEVTKDGYKSYMEHRVKFQTLGNEMGVFEPTDEYGRADRASAKYEQAAQFLRDYKEFRKKIGKMKKHSGAFMAEELSDIPKFYWTKDESAVTPDVAASEAGYESEEALLQAIRDFEEKKKKMIPLMKESEEVISEEKEYRKEFDRGQRYGYSRGYKEASREVRQRLTDKSLSQQEMKDVIVDYANEYLPKDLRGGLITQVRDAKTMLDAFKAFQRADEIVENGQKAKLVESLKKSLSRAADAKNISIEYKQMLNDLSDSLSFTTPRAETLERIQKTKDYIESEIKAGREVAMPKYIYDSLKILDRTPVKSLSLEELEYMIDQVEFAVELGKTKLRARQYVYEADKERILAQLSAAKLNKFQTTENLGGVIKKAADWALLLNKARAPMDHFFYSLGDDAHRVFKEGMDLKYNNYLSDRRAVEEKLDEKVKSLQLDDKNMERIGIYAANQQDGGREKLLNQYSEAEIDAVKLTPNEKQFYDFMRAELEAVRAPYEKTLNEVFNLPLGKVASYFPFLSDFEAMSDWEIRDRFASLAEYSPQLRKTVDLSSQKQRVDRIGIQKVRVDAANVFSQHMDQVFYAIHMSEEIKKLQEIARADQYRQAAGDIGQEITRQWLDVMARKGGRATRKTGFDKSVDFLRKNMSVATLVGNPASIALQLTATMDGAMLIGNYAFTGQPLAYQSDWRNFALDNSAALKNRVGDDFAYREFGKSWWGKMQSGAMTPQKAIDGIVATGVWIGAYNKYLDENKLTMDFKNPNSKAVEYANRMMTMTQASGSFKDLPVSISRGVGTGGNESMAKALAQYQTFAFFRWANIADVMPKLLKEGDYATAAQIASWWTIANLSEIAVRHGIKGIVGLMFMALLGGKGESDKEDPLWAQLVGSMFGNIPYISNIVSMIQYKSNPIAVVSAIQNALQSWEYMSKSKNPSKKAKWATVAALQSAGLLAGAPTGQAAKMIKQADMALSEKPFEKYLDTDSKAKSMYRKFKDIRSEVDNQYKAIKEDPQAFDGAHRSRIMQLNRKINTVEARVAAYNKRGNGDASAIKSALEEINRVYSS